MSEGKFMNKVVTECFTAEMNYNNAKVNVLFVPLFDNEGKEGWVGPGYWQPNLTVKKPTPPNFKYNTRVYTRKELLDAGATVCYEQLWAR